LIVGVLLKLVGLNQQIQPSRQSLRKTHGFPMIKPSEFAKNSNCELAKEAWQILETTYEGTKLVKSAKL